MKVIHEPFEYLRFGHYTKAQERLHKMSKEHYNVSEKVEIGDYCYVSDISEENARHVKHKIKLITKIDMQCTNERFVGVNEETGTISGWVYAVPIDELKEKRVIIQNKRKLVEILLKEGYIPDNKGDFKHAIDKFTNVAFVAGMWDYVGHKVSQEKVGLYFIDGYRFKESWTELI